MTEREMTVKAMELLAEIITVTKASGTTGHNPIIRLDVIDRVGCKDMFGQPLRDCLVVRPVYENNPNRDDGYYDICIEGDSPWGAVLDVVSELKRKF